MFEYIAAGKPILFDFISNYNPIVIAGAGIETDGKLIDNVVVAINHIYDEKDRLDTSNPAEILSKEYDFSSLTRKLIKIIEQ